MRLRNQPQQRKSNSQA